MNISSENLSVTLDGRRIINGLSASIASGSKVGLLGPNGSGKSTLLRSLAGLYKDVRSDVFIHHQSLNSIPHRKLATMLALVTQHASLDGEMTVEQLVRLGRTPYRSLFSAWSDADKAAVEDALTRTRLTSLRHSSYLRLSGGQQQRCQIARALAQQPDILLLDEPTNHLDIQYQLELMTLIAELPVTTIVALHDLNLAANYCDYLLVLKEGELVAEGHPEDVLTAALIQQIYGVHASVEKSYSGEINIVFHKRNAALKPRLQLIG
ncbi:ABC transporter ATP-binding protein [Pseudomonas cerasi]